MELGAKAATVLNAVAAGKKPPTSAIVAAARAAFSVANRAFATYPNLGVTISNISNEASEAVDRKKALRDLATKYTESPVSGETNVRYGDLTENVRAQVNTESDPSDPRAWTKKTTAALKSGNISAKVTLDGYVVCTKHQAKLRPFDGRFHCLPPWLGSEWTRNGYPKVTSGCWVSMPAAIHEGIVEASRRTPIVPTMSFAQSVALKMKGGK